MANKRKLKKRINLICEALFAECVAVSLYGPEENKENLNAHVFSIVKLQDNAIRRVSHPEPGIPAKKYFQNLREQFSAQVSDILDQLNA
ncbi:MAG: hypothetical protein IJV25_02625 [Prevotella sp.]|nr:hypothetical protein [Prevotella sp.]MBQ9649292.1 hypothetical protein [Prevotella sp.]